MSFYIKDEDICRLAHLDTVKDLLISFISKKEKEIPIYLDNYDGYNLLTKCDIDYKNTNNYSVTLIVSMNEICVNPCVDIKGGNYTRELYEYILDIKSELRDLTIKSIIND